MSLTDPRTVHVPEHLGDVDYEALLLDAPIATDWSLNTRTPKRFRTPTDRQGMGS